MKNTCLKCSHLRVTLGWSARPQITELGSGKILPNAYLDKMLNEEFYTPNANLDEWPVCPDCSQPLKSATPLDEAKTDYEDNAPAELPKWFEWVLGAGIAVALVASIFWIRYLLLFIFEM